MSKKALPAHEIGSGNIFADLGLLNAEEHQLKAALVVQLGVTTFALSLRYKSTSKERLVTDRWRILAKRTNSELCTLQT
jgi:hypothetical protein